MKDLCKDTGRILFIIRLFLFVFLLCTVLFCGPVKKSLDLSGVDSVCSQSELMTVFNYDIPTDLVCRIHTARTLISPAGHFHKKVHLYSLQNVVGALRNHCIPQRNMAFLMQKENHFLSILQT